MVFAFRYHSLDLLGDAFFGPDTVYLTVLLSVEPVAVPFTASVPELGTFTTADVEVPFQCKV